LTVSSPTSATPTSTDKPRPLALVTGASSGIGHAFVELLAADGYDVITVARSMAPMREHAAALKAAHGAEVYPLALDLTSAGAVDEMRQQASALGRPVSLLVNNAGFGVLGAFAEKSHQDGVGMVELNTRALVDVTHAFLPDLLETRGGLINVASLSAYMPMPWMSVYSASKAFALTFTRMLRVELKPQGVTVTALCPGYTTSAFHIRAGVDKVDLPAMMPMQSPQTVAEAGYRAWQSGRGVVVPGIANKLAALTARFIQPLINLLGAEANRRVNGPGPNNRGPNNKSQ
jgi:short-subunit dehydrogenase